MASFTADLENACQRHGATSALYLEAADLHPPAVEGKEEMAATGSTAGQG